LAPASRCPPDGSTLAVGAWGADGTGAVYMYTRSGVSWTQQAYVTASNAGGGDQFGVCVALSADGSVLAVGANREGSAASGVGGDQSDNSKAAVGAAYVFTRSGSTWNQQAYIKASNPDWFDQFATTIALSGDGTTLAVGTTEEPSAATGINGDQSDNSAASAGAVYVFGRSGTTWSQQAYVKASNTNRLDQFGASVALSGDGATLAVGAHGEASAATGIGGNQADNSVGLAGAIYVFGRSGTTWSQQAYLKASNTAHEAELGVSVALSADGARLAAGAWGDPSAARGVNGNQADQGARQAGAVYVFARSGATWIQHAYVKASNTHAGNLFGSSVALSSDGAALAVGAVGEDSAATGIDGNEAHNGIGYAGAVYVLDLTALESAPL
jgi:FG-GAP repeat protein